jgi:hypothetical protein
MSRPWKILCAVMLVITVPAIVLADRNGEPAQDKSKTIDAMGTVSAVALDSLTVKGKAAEWTFTVDKETTVVVKGATRKNLELKAEGKSPRLTDFVKVKDEVTVSYHDLGATKHADTIRVTRAAGAK